MIESSEQATRMARLSRRGFLSGTAGIAAGLALAACAPQGAAGPSVSATLGPADLRMAWWGADARHAKVQKVLELFSAKHPDISVEPQFGGFDGYFDKLATQTSGGNAPDVFQLLQEFVPDYGGRGQLLNLDPYVGGLLKLDDFNPDAVVTGRIDDKLSAVSYGDSSPAIVYNTTMLQGYGLDLPDPEWTWEDYAELSRQVYKKSGGTVYGTTDPGAASFVLEVWMRQKGKELYTAEGELGFDKADLIEWFEFWADLRKDGGIVAPEVNAAILGQGQQPIITGQAAMWSNYPLQMTIVEPLLPAGVELDCTLIPSSPDQVRPGQFIRAVVWLGAYAKSKSPEESVALINFIVNDVEAGEVLGTEFGVPPSLAVREAIASTLTPMQTKVVEYTELVADHSTPQTIPIPTGGGEVYGNLYLLNEEIAFGRVSIDEGVDRFFSDAERALR